MFAAYARTGRIAILLAGAAIEGYVNYAGHAIVPKWDDYVKTAKTFSDKLKRVFAERKKTIALDSGIYQRTIALFDVSRLFRPSPIHSTCPKTQFPASHSI